MTTALARQAEVKRLEVAAYKVPTDSPESDGTLSWDSTTLVLVRAEAGGRQGLGWTYAEEAAGRLIRDKLEPKVLGRDAMDIPACRQAMVRSLRNVGEDALCMMAVAAVDNALWDLKARLLDLPLASLLGQARAEVPAYGSGGFTSYTVDRLCRQLRGWAGQGLRMVKMKVGREPAADPDRVAAARQAIGPSVALFVDANGAYGRKQALDMALRFSQQGVSWLEEPVDHHDIEGLRLLRDRGPAGMDVSAGEYGFRESYFLGLLRAGAVDVLQADATRCGISGFLEASALCQAFGIPLSSHCAPSLHLPLACACAPVRHVEYFHDHARIERMLFDGAAEPADGVLRPDLSRPGLGLELKGAEAEKFAV